MSTMWLQLEHFNYSYILFGVSTVTRSYYYAMVTTTIRLRFDGCSTAVRRLVEGHEGLSDVSR